MLNESWYPPMKNCGLCGDVSCENFMKNVDEKKKNINECIYYSNNLKTKEDCNNYGVKDLNGHEFDFVLKAVPGEVSARKIIRPFRADLIERFSIKKGDYVMGRPMGAGCPVTHVLEVYKVDEIAGVLYTWVVGPDISRNNKVIDINAYGMTGFEGIATQIKRTPQFGKKAGFMPAFCMLRLTHYGLVNMVLEQKEGLLVRVEDIHIA